MFVDNARKKGAIAHGLRKKEKERNGKGKEKYGELSWSLRCRTCMQERGESPLLLHKKKKKKKKMAQDVHKRDRCPY
jgi:hypothetical protein